MSTAEDVTVRDNPEENRYEIHVDGQLGGNVTYERRDGVTALLHTEVFDGFEGRGLAGTLVSYALDDLRTRGDSVEPECSYVDSYLTKHPEYADLRA